MPYSLSPLFCVRLAGVPFDVLESLGTPAVFELARAAAEAEAAVDREGAAALAIGRELGVVKGAARRLRAAVTQRRPIPEPAVAAATPSYTAALDAYDRGLRTLAERLAVEDDAARARLVSHAGAVLPDFLVFESATLLALLGRLDAQQTGVQRAVRRKRERHLAMYLQRVCAKNDTISRFGPTSWGVVRADARGFAIDPRPGVSRREVQLERWVVATIVAAINGDPDARAELCPRRHPDGRLEDGTFVRLDVDRRVALSADELDVLERLDGRTPAHTLAAPAVLASLAEQGVIVWALELIAWDAHPLATLRDDLARWRDTAVRARWLGEVDALDEIARRFAGELDPDRRASLIAGVTTRCLELGGTLPSGRTLYQARNPIIEECARETNAVVGGDLAAAVMADIGPWIDLFRDTYSLAASHCYHHLRALHASAPRRGGAVVLTELLAHCEASGSSLRGAGLSRIARATLALVKRELGEVLGTRPDAPEWTLTAADCRVLRDRHSFPVADEFSWAAPDLQLAASSVEAVARGDYQWIVGELHLMVSPLQYGLDWSCPDLPTLREAFRGLAAGRPWVLPSRAGFHTTSVHGSPERLVELVPDFVLAAPERGKPSWRTVAPSEAEVIVDDRAHDLRVRSPAGEDLGSLIRTPIFMMGIHPFFPLELAPHTPRLRIGKTIVQRRTWHVSWEELGCAAPDATSPAVLTAIERLRARRELPRFVYVRPSAGAVERVEMFQRDKDVKPVYIDLESTIFADIFVRRLAEYTRLEVVEMTPAPDQLLWREADGRYCFELRAMCPPVP